jgi:hypothetical protein
MSYLPLLAVTPSRGGMGFGGPGGSQSPYALAGVASERFNNDFQKTLTEMYVDNHIKPIQNWASTLGMGFRVQISGLAASYVTVPEGDNGDDVDSFSGKAAARDIGGHKILSDEAATFVGGQSAVANWVLMLFMIQRDYSGGVNQVVLHGFSYADSPGATWPGFSSFGRAIGNDWGPRSPEWTLASDITAYVSRLQRVLQAGRHQVDIAVLGASRRGPGEGFGRGGNTSGVLSFSDRLRYAGYTRASLSEDLLTHPNAIARNGRLVPDGPAYKALVVNQLSTMEPATAQRLIGYARAGPPIILVGEPPTRTPGLYQMEQQEAALRTALAELTSIKNVTRVADEAAALTALSAAGVKPSLGFSKRSRVSGLCRNDGKTGYFYFLNDSDASNEVTLSLAGKDKPFRINLWSGSVEPVAIYTEKEGRVEIPVAFGPNEAVVIVLSSDKAFCASAPAVHAVSGEGEWRVVDGRLSVRATKAGRYSAKLSDGKDAVAQVGVVAAERALPSWSIAVEQWLPGNSPMETRKVNHNLNLTNLTAWTNIPELKEASGVGKYTTSVTLDSSWSKDQGAWLDLSQVGGTFRVYVNGKQLPPANQFVHRVDIGPYLKAGENRIEFVLATNLNNVLKAIGATSDFGAGPSEGGGAPGGVGGAKGGGETGRAGVPGGDAPSGERGGDAGRGGIPSGGRGGAPAAAPFVEPDPMAAPKGSYLGAPAAGDSGMSPGAGNPGGSRTQQDYGLIGPVKLVPYRVATIKG